MEVQPHGWIAVMIVGEFHGHMVHTIHQGRLGKYLLGLSLFESVLFLSGSHCLIIGGTAS